MGRPLISGKRKKKDHSLDGNADPFLLYSVPQTPTGAHKAGMHGEWDSFHHESRPDKYDWLYWLFFLIAIGVMGYCLVRFVGLI